MNIHSARTMPTRNTYVTRQTLLKASQPNSCPIQKSNTNHTFSSSLQNLLSHKSKTRLHSKMCVTPLYEYQICHHSAGRGETEECAKAFNWEVCVQMSRVISLPGRCQECRRQLALRAAAVREASRR
jgi:hypothetical protein